MTRNKTENQQYVSSVTLNGEQLMRSYLTGSELYAGGQLVVNLSHEPSVWGSEHRPPSVSRD